MPNRRTVDSITVAQFIERHAESLKLELVSNEDGLTREIEQPTINRPGLALAGFFSYFAHKRIQVIGNSEQAYLKQLGEAERNDRFRKLCQQNIPCLIVSRGNRLDRQMLAIANAEKVPVLTTPKITMSFINKATAELDDDFADNTSLHGCMMDIRGIGVLIMGKSGSGKSETAIGLLEKGGALVADDLVRVKSLNHKLVAYSPAASQGYLEMRGIGIINVANLYGLGAIRPEKRLDLVVTLKNQSDLNEVDRVGITRKSIEILDIDVPHVEIPVAPGRDTARLINVAALDHQLRVLGYDMADEFNQRLKEKMMRGESQFL